MYTPSLYIQISSMRYCQYLDKCNIWVLRWITNDCNDFRYTVSYSLSHFPVYITFWVIFQIHRHLCAQITCISWNRNKIFLFCNEQKSILILLRLLEKYVYKRILEFCIALMMVLNYLCREILNRYIKDVRLFRYKLVICQFSLV